MPHKTLFVDDERPLLNGIERRLGFDYELDTAESGTDALRLISENGPYSVVFTDMRMPRMDGLEFLERARAAAPDSIYVMLTGNNDQVTATRALNEGRVFRFLNKPCESEELKRTIDDGIRQFELVRSEKELLHNTFLGAVRALTDVVEVCRPELAGRSTSVEEKVEIIRQAVGVENRWEYRLAGRLSLLGIALLPDDERRVFERADHASELVSHAVEHSSQISKRLLSGIPRLQVVAEICGYAEEVTGGLCSLRPKSEGSVTQVGATLLRIATHWDFLSQQGVCSSRLARELKQILPETPPAISEAIAKDDTATDAGEGVRVPADRLSEGMVTAADVHDTTGSLLLRQGQRLSAALVEKLKAQKGIPSIEITRVTAGGADAPAGVAS